VIQNNATLISGMGVANATSGKALLVVGEGYLGTFPLLGGRSLLVGRDNECDVSLPHDKVSRHHARIHVSDLIEVEDLGSTNGTRVAGERIAPAVRIPVAAGRNIQFGPYVAVIVAAAERAAAEEPLRAAISVTDPTPEGVPELVIRMARGAVSVLITGETGVGKEVLAQTLHKLSGRTGQMVAINCASLSEALLESELFGHERGAFTGAARSKPGLFEVAAGGTVFLDEIGELPMALQAKLLRVLETKAVYRVGGVKPIALDVRFLAATHRDLADDVTAGRFRRDLYFRVNGIVLSIVPLRERTEAIGPLATRFLAHAVGPGGTPPRLGTAALAALMQHPWPGNVRELRTVMERAAVVCDGPELRASHIMLDRDLDRDRDREEGPVAMPSAGGDDEERARILAALDACAGNQTRAARQLGISRTTLVHKLDIHRIPRPRVR
jgi:two-component system, NtrC family, response regulator AtoC